MSVFRIERTKDYTVMSNYHLKDKTLSLKAKGLLSQMLSLPEDWDYTLSGLAYINREKIDAIRQNIKELEMVGYIVRPKKRDERQHGDPDKDMEKRVQRTACQEENAVPEVHRPQRRGKGSRADKKEC